MIITLTGKAGSGKSTAAKLMAKYLTHSYILNVDKLGKSLLNEKDVIFRLKRTFGDAIAYHNKIDTHLLSAIVFKNNRNLRRLNNIMHLKLKNKLRYQLKEIKISKLKIKHIIVDAALCDELKLRRISDILVLIKVNDNIASKRISTQLFLRRKFQKDTKDFDFIINNNFNKVNLKKQINKLCTNLNKHYAHKYQ